MSARITCEPVLFLYMFGIYLLYGVIHNLIYSRVCEENVRGYTNVSSNCAEIEGILLETVQAETSHWIRWSTACMVLPSIVVDCYMGSWSDLFGRKVTLTLPVLG